LKIKAFGLLAFGLLAFASQAPAVLLFSNLGQLDDGNTNGLGQTTDREATAFVTGSDLTSITGLSVRAFNEDDIAHTFSAFLYSNSGGAPGSLLATFTPVDNSIPQFTMAKILTFSLSSYNLAANAQYWIALSALQTASTESFGWRDTASYAVESGSIFATAAAPSRKLSVDGGGTWPFNRSGNNFFSLEGSVVPEPSVTALLLGTGVLAAAFVRRRK
jgi:hypothetical protein